jgi:hypothetical protein
MVVNEDSLHQMQQPKSRIRHTNDMKTQCLGSTLAIIAASFVITGASSNLARGGTLSGMATSLAGITTSIDLTGEGQRDWAYWGYVLPTDFDQKEGGTNEIDNYLQIGTNSALSYGNSESVFNWEDGTPDLTATNMTSGIYFIGVSNGYEVDVTADATPRLFNIYVGTWAATIHFEAELSDGSAPTYIDETFSHDTLGGPNRRYSIIYAADSSGQTLKVKAWPISTVDVNGNVTLQAASLERVPLFGVSRPTVTPTNVFAAGTPVTISVEPQGPFPYFYQWLENSGGGFVPVPGSDTGTLALTTTNFNGVYTYEVVITNNSGGAVTSAPVTLTATVPTGVLKVTSFNLAAVAEINLTTEGVLDWADWGLTQPTDFNDKTGVTSQIGDYIPVGASQLDYYQFGNNAQGFSWTDGSPTSAETNATTGVYVTGLGNGFEVDVKAQQTNRLFNLYAGVYTPGGNLATLHIEASLSDGSAPVFIDESVSGTENVRFSMAFAAGSPGQTLIVKYWVIGASDGDVFLQAASLKPLSTLSASQPAISPTNVVAVGSTVKLSTQVQGLFPYSYQWQSDNGGVFVDIADSNTNAIYVSPDSPGSYTYRVVVSNSSQTVTSTPSVLTITPATSTLTVTSRDVQAFETIYLTTEGTLDWAAWGLSLPTDFDDKAGVTSQISNYIAIGTSTDSGQYGNNNEGFTWTDGTPTSAETNTTTGIWVSGPAAGYEVDVPAAAPTRTLTMYVGAYLATAHFEASLSDGSAPYYVDESFSTSNPNGSDRDYTITYAAPSKGPAPYLIVRYWQIEGEGNITLNATSLQGSIAVNLSLQPVAGRNLQLTWPRGTLLEATNLAGPWLTNGSPSPYTFAPSAPQEFFRVIVQ